jgi:tRNA(fMet)-specific endonuclease VapC
VKAELFYGALRSVNPVQSLARLSVFLNGFRSLPLDDPAAEIAGRIRADLAAVGMPIGAHDMQIAAIALANNLTLVTHDTREFGRINGLRYEDWETAP